MKGIGARDGTTVAEAGFVAVRLYPGGNGSATEGVSHGRSSTTSLDPYLNVPEFQHQIEIPRMHDEAVGGQDVHDHRTRLRKRQPVVASTPALALQEGIRDGRSRHVAVPTVVGTPFEMVEAEFGLQFGVLLFDGPPLKGQADEGLQRRGLQ